MREGGREGEREGGRGKEEEKHDRKLFICGQSATCILPTCPVTMVTCTQSCELYSEAFHHTMS